ncbi:MAG: serine hydrolase [Patescibacteria group bacterium]
MFLSRRGFFIIGLLSSFAAGVFLSPMIHPGFQNAAVGESFSQIRSRTAKAGSYQFINPLLGCEVQGPQHTYAEELKQEIEEVIAHAIQKGDASVISVYFDTRDGRWFGINTSELYYPASMLKVPLMMAYLKVAEENPDILSKELSYEETRAPDPQFFPPTKQLEQGKPYTIDMLIEYMIRYSNNEAAEFLFRALEDIESVEDIFTDLGVSSPRVQKDIADYMTVQSYARFFRVLYNASYLGRTMSEKALSLLSMTDFPRGITAPLPASLTASHKFGERTMPGVSADRRQELHDCGIVYHPKHDYLLCIMTKGSNPDALVEQIQNISRTVYQYMNVEFQPS